MNLGRIIKPIEDEIAAKKAEAEAAQAEKEAQEKQLFEIHARKIHEALKGVVRPVLIDAIEQLGGFGHFARVAAYTSEDNRIRDIVVRIELDLAGKKSDPQYGYPKYALEFVGDVENLSVAVLEKINSPRIPIKGAERLQLREIDGPLVVKFVEAFIERAVRANAG